jgi:hypothetical protein
MPKGKGYPEKKGTDDRPPKKGGKGKMGGKKAPPFTKKGK